MVVSTVSLENQYPRVGIGVLIIFKNRVLLGKRKSAHGTNTWAPPGGHLEFGETFEECARRETLEETGLLLADIYFAGVTNDIFMETNKHYVTIFMSGKYCGGVPRVCEPDKCFEWQWFFTSALPENLFLPLKNLLESGFKLV